MPEGARFCPTCGHALHAVADERRVVTVVFGDLVGFTALSETRDPEQVKNLVDRCFALLANDITTYGGRVDKVVGDAVVALFGAPLAHEDDAERAVRAALQMQRTIEREAPRMGAPVRRRIVQKVNKALRDEQLYRNSSLNLRTLSSHIKENEHYVSQVLNQELGTTFYELVNGLRIEHAKRLLKSDLERSVLDVALEVGFNAKSTFNTAFRRHVGMTPSDFRAKGPVASALEVQSGRPELR